MAVKIRLQRHGKKGKPLFHIVVADARAPRDGKFIEKIGAYNPITNPATIELNVTRSVEWLINGAQPTDTTRAILSYKGALYMKHLSVGVQKGKLTQEQADAKFAEWVSAKEAKVSGKVDSLSKAKTEKAKAALVAEAKVKEAKTKSIEAKKSALTAEVEAAVAEETVVEATEEVVVAEVETSPEAAVEVVAEVETTPEAETEAPAEEGEATEENKEA